MSALASILSLDGSVAVALVDCSNGLLLMNHNKSDFDLELAAAVNTEVVRAKIRAIERLGLDDQLEDVLVTLGKQHHLIRVLQRPDLKNTFIYLVLCREEGNLALARRALENAESTLSI